MYFLSDLMSDWWNPPFLLFFLEPECVIEKVDIIFLVDASVSIDETEFTSMVNFMETIVDQTTVGKDQTRFGVIFYNDEAKSHFTLKDYDTKRKILEALPKTRPEGRNTETGLALEYTLEFFNAEHGGRKALKVPQILMVITDGAATDPYNLEGPSNALRDNGIIVLSIGVKEAKQDQLETIAGGDKSKVFNVDNFEALNNLVKNISSVLCEIPKSGKSASWHICGADTVVLKISYHLS